MPSPFLSLSPRKKAKEETLLAKEGATFRHQYSIQEIDKNKI
jgi:hypothetical protein